MVLLLLIYSNNIGAQEPYRQSTTGPTPPPEVTFEPDTVLPGDGQNLVSGVPAYLWRHGCGPTAVGMVVGYYDTHTYGDLVPGSAASQTSDVNQAIASQGSAADPQHYEDYSQPIDSYPSLLLDLSEPPPGDEHASNCIADFMKTSWSSEGNYYGWSWSNDIGPGFTEYVGLANPDYAPASATYYMGSSLTFALVQAQIDSGKPMVFLVDSNGDGSTDHFVTIIGYRDISGYPEYACWDTWSATQVRWQRFRAMSSSYSWGVWGGFCFGLSRSVTVNSPNGGEVLTAGASYQIAWSPRSIGIDHFRLLLSGNGGQSYNDTIAPSVPSTDTTFDWLAPALSGNSFRVKVQLLTAADSLLAADQSDGDFSIVPSGVESTPHATPSIKPGWAACFPNPARGRFCIRFSLRQPSPVTLRVYNTCGQLVEDMGLGVRSAGNHEIRPTRIAKGPGIYFYELQAGEQEFRGRITVVR